MWRLNMSKSIQMVTLGSNITRLRTEVGLTQEDLGKAVSVTGSTISNYERGNVEKPDTATLLSIADYFHVDMSELWKRQDKTVDTKILAYRGRKIQLHSKIHVYENYVSWGEEKFLILVRKSSSPNGELIFDTKVFMEDGTPLTDVEKFRILKDAWIAYAKDNFGNGTGRFSDDHVKQYNDRFSKSFVRPVLQAQ
jgi:transcriptional regulator with XRE-family HTH domain